MTKLPKVNITACISPLINRYANIYQLAEFLEVHRMFGIGRVIFYNESTNSTIDNYLRYYITKGIVSVMPWHLDEALLLSSNLTIEHGQQVAQIDCFYRSMASSNFVTFLDLDELLVLRTAQFSSLTDIIMDAQQYVHKSVCDYQFRHAYFPISNALDESRITDPQVSKWRIHSLWHIQRSEFWKARKRSKYIADARYLIMPSVHEPRFCRWGSMEVVVPVTKGALHHYRSRPLQGATNWTDRTLWFYKKDIMPRIMTVHETLSGPWISYHEKSVHSWLGKSYHC